MGDYYESALLRLRRVTSYLSIKYGDVVRDAEITSVQFEVLLFIASEKTCSVTDVSRFMVVDKSMSSRVLRGMETKGLIETTNDEADRRRRVVQLTAKGQNLVDSYKKPWLTVEKEVCSKFDTAIERLENL